MTLFFSGAVISLPFQMLMALQNVSKTGLVIYGGELPQDGVMFTVRVAPAQQGLAFLLDFIG